MSRRWLVGLILVLLAAGTTWYLRQLEEARLPLDRGSQHEPDFFMEEFTSLIMDARGVPHRKLTAERLDHFPDTDTNELTKPHLELYNDGEAPWHVVSERGWVSPDREEILLQGRVFVWQDSQTGQRVIDIVTRDVRVTLDDQYAETEEPALIRTPDSETHGLGLPAFLDQGRFELLSQVRTVLNGK